MHRVAIVDDERLARRELRDLLAAHPSVQVVAEAETVAAAEEVIRAADADIVFLDIQLRAESGFDLLPRLDEDVRVIFVTAFDQFAVRAFEANALDYLLKPVRPERLARSLDRLHAPPPASPPARLEYDDFLFLRILDRMRFVPLASIISITAEGDYSALLLDDGTTAHLRRAVREWEARLPARNFIRVHRSSIVNLEHVDRVEEWSHHSYRLWLRNSSQPLEMSRRYAAALRQQRG